jgi:polyisoprenyl-teichoic acid--peptidoglycan teichoic acid transferase
MNNFKSHKKIKSRRNVSIDGISTSGNTQDFRSEDRKARADNQIGNFAQSQGFHSTVRSNLTTDTRDNKHNSNSRFSENIEDNTKSKVKKPKHGKSRLKVFRKTFVSVLLIGVLGAGFLFGKGYLRALQIFRGGGAAAALQDNVDPARLKGEGDGRVNILLLGKGGVGHEAPDLTDTILIASIDPVQKEAALLSLPRDFYVSSSTNRKLNAVYSDAKQRAIYKGDSSNDAETAGLDAIENKVEEILGVPIHYNGMIDFAGFKKAINTVGGIDINITDPVYDNMHINGVPYTLNVKTGNQHFDGTRALMFARSRKTSIRGDFDRSERQRLVLIALRQKVFSIGTFSNPVKLNQLLDAFGKHIRTNLTIPEMLRVYEVGLDIDADKIASVGLADPPNNYIVTANLNGISIVRPRAGLQDYSEIHNFVRNRIRDGFLTSEDASVSVLNGTNINGLATITANELKSFGYKITNVANAPIKNQKSTVIVDMNNGTKKYTKAYLERRFGVAATTTLPDASIDTSGADFVIILGVNEQTRLQN